MLEPLGFGAAILAQVVSVLAGRANKRDLRGPSYRIFSTNGVILALVSFLAKFCASYNLMRSNGRIGIFAARPAVPL